MQFAKVSAANIWRIRSFGAEAARIWAISPQSCLQPYCSGSDGTAHSENYHIADPESAAVLSAYFQLSLIDRLLRDDAAAAKEVVRKKNPPFASKDAFFHFLDTISTVHTPIREKGSDAIEICWN